ncbi:MAG: 16S rRNA (guanine(527)-N(7))-methyltransferase RsmG [Paracoccaceae bacterium]|nr:16S rRNA (guanine(527)-N(7))-methyltransferase RsmG [Paracoccaceae bacterium]
MRDGVIGEAEARNALRTRLDVSRETFQKLDRYAELLAKWSAGTNLVSANSLRQVWSRHFLDSAQILAPAECRRPSRWADFGSGAGFPGMVVAILAHDRLPDLRVTLFESHARKCAFLDTVSRETFTPVTIVNERVEPLRPGVSDRATGRFDVISARAVAPLAKLLGIASGRLETGGVCLFPKGKGYDREIADARKEWAFDVVERVSLTDPRARILEIGGISRVQPL